MLAFIVRWTPLWLVKRIQYLMLKIMKRLRMSDDRRPAIATARHAVEEFLLPNSFDLFNDIRFRQAAKFDQLSQSEHDRIFNELIVSAMTMALFGIARAEVLVKPGDYHFWRSVHDQLLKQFERALRDFGANQVHTKQYRELITLRYDEYEQLAKQAWDIWNTEEQEFQKLPPIGQEIASWVNAVAIGTADHIKRGKLNQKDKLPCLLRQWLFGLNERIGKFIKRL